MKQRFKDKTAVITGGGRGIGAACARHFAAAGANVVIASRTKSELDEVVREIGKNQGQCLAVECDVSNEASVKILFAEAKNRFGPVDILVNNAAIATVGDFTTMAVKDWDALMAVNLRGAFLCAREAFSQIRTSGKKAGAIVNLSSLGGIRGTEKFKGTTAYVVSKFGMVGLTESLAVEGRDFGIRVNCIAPGAVDTAMLKQAAPHLKTRTTPDDVAPVVLFLCDDAQSGSVSGTVVEIFSNVR